MSEVNVVEKFASLLWILGGLAFLTALFGAPFWLYSRYRSRYRESPAFKAEWRESQNEQVPFRSAEQAFSERLRVEGSAEWGAKIGFFLGILGFLWTPLVFLGMASGMVPMWTVGLPGLVVSWSLFLGSRSFLKNGPAAVPLIRFGAIAEIALNVWVLALVVLCTMHDGMNIEDPARDGIQRLLLARSGMHEYEMAYSMQRFGVVSVGYALLSFLHAGLQLRSLGLLERFRGLKAREQETAV